MEGFIMSAIGKIIWNKGHTAKGVVTNEGYRYCAACGRDHACFIVHWDDGSRSKPCTAGIKALNDEFEIV
jgi:hypothetical protein